MNKECESRQDSNFKFGAVILAAGYSSRMGSFKPILPIGDETVVERLIRISKEAGISDIVVVTGHNREELRSYIDRKVVREAFNERFHEGMFTSMQTGTAALPDSLDGFFMMPVDCPLITVEILQQMMETFDAARFSVACYRGKKGHPLLIPEKFRQEIIDYDGKGGLKAITDRDFSLMNRLETGYEGVVMDMDTPQAYAEIKDYLSAGCKSDNLQELAIGRRFLLIRHGQIQQHKEKIFLGQTDVPLSDKGREQAELAAQQLKKLEIKTDRIYTSDLSRAFQTAEIIKKHNGINYLIPEPGLREMNLGPWDGKYISEIRLTMPEEYEKRGQNMMIYKMGHGSENFYDLQYRAVRTLADILKKDNCRDVIITAHSGVLRAICNNLQGNSVADPWDKMDNGEIRIIEL